MTTRAKRSAKSVQIEALLGGDRELLKGLVKESLQEVLEGEMTETLGAGARAVNSTERRRRPESQESTCVGRDPVSS
jgi:transposase-like protein